MLWCRFRRHLIVKKEKKRKNIRISSAWSERVYGNTAVETGLSTMNGQDKGKTVPRDTRFTRVWVKQGRWRLVANH